MSILIFLIIALVMNLVIAKRGLGVLAWTCLLLTFLAAIAVVLRLQQMVPESWSLGLWVVGVTCLMLMVIPMPKFGKFGVVARVLVALTLVAYPVWVVAQMGMVYLAILSEDDELARQRVDFTAMQDGVEEQLSRHFEAVDAARVSQEPEEEGLVAGVKSMFSSGARISRRWLVKKTARSILTPSGLRQILKQEPRESPTEAPPWNKRLRIEDANRWKFWTNAGWVGFEPGGENECIQLRSIEFSPEVLAQIEEIESDVN